MGKELNDEQRTTIVKWTGDIFEIRRQVGRLLADRKIYLAVRQLYTENPELKDRRTVYSALGRWYGGYMAVAIRRLAADTHKEAISLWTLLKSMKGNPLILPWLYNPVPVPEIEGDQAALEALAQRVADFVDQYIAHTQRKPVGGLAPMTLDEVHGPLDALVVMADKYMMILRATGPADDDPAHALPDDWMRVFDIPWRR